MDIVALKQQLSELTHNILCEYNQIHIEKLEVQDNMNANIRHLQNINDSLVYDMETKDKQIKELELQNQKSLQQCHEYSEMINSLHEKIQLLEIIQLQTCKR